MSTETAIIELNFYNYYIINHYLVYYNAEKNYNFEAEGKYSNELKAKILFDLKFR